MPKFYPRQKIDLTARPEWAHYDVNGVLSDMIMDSAFATTEAMTAQDLTYYAKQAIHGDLSDDQKAHLYAAFKNRDDRIEGFRTLLRDMAFWAWQEAYIPTDLDLHKAFTKAKNEVPSTYADWFAGRDNLWEVYKAFGYGDTQQSKFIWDLLESVHIEDQKAGKQGRFLIYDPAASALVNRMATEVIRPVSDGGVLDWSPPMASWTTGLIQELRELLDELKEIVIKTLFQKLNDSMNVVDYSFRMNYPLALKKVMRASELKTIGKEIKEFLAASPSLGANPFMNPRNRRLEKDFLEMKALAEASPILEFDVTGDPPEKYLLRFHGFGLDPDETIRDLHEVTVNLGADYPRSMPFIRWHTPLLHPNISAGTACLGNFVMNPRIRLVDIVEVLWDMTRMASYNYHGNEAVWGKHRKTFGFPVDPRTIRGEVPQAKDPGGDVDLVIMGRY